MAQMFEDNDDDERPEFDESQAGPEYWAHKRDKYRKKSFARCLKCNIKQELQISDDGIFGVCPNKRCEYKERII